MGDTGELSRGAGGGRCVAGALAGLDVIVVDDDRDGLDLLATWFELEGATVRRAASAREARAAYLERRPDAIVSDIAMPGEDGIGLIRSIRRIERAAGSPPVPAVAVTGFANRLKDVSLAAGFQEHFARPVDAERLVGAVARLVGAGA